MEWYCGFPLDSTNKWNVVFFSSQLVWNAECWEKTRASSINIIVQANDEKLHKTWTTSSIYICMYRILGIHGRIIIRWFDTCCHNRNPICADYLLKYEKWLVCVCLCVGRKTVAFFSLFKHMCKHGVRQLLPIAIQFNIQQRIWWHRKSCLSAFRFHPYTQYIHAIIVNLITSN